MTTKRLDFLEQITFGLFVIMKKVTFVKWDISVLYYLDSFFVKTENIKHKKIHKAFGFYFYHFEVIWDDSSLLIIQQVRTAINIKAACQYHNKQSKAWFQLVGSQSWNLLSKHVMCVLKERDIFQFCPHRHSSFPL